MAVHPDDHGPELLRGRRSHPRTSILSNFDRHYRIILPHSTYSILSNIDGITTPNVSPRTKHGIVHRMRIHPEEDDRITLTLKEIIILTVLADRPLDGQDIARACARITRFEFTMSNGALYPALKRLQEHLGLIQHDPDAPGEYGRKVYSLTGLGKLILGWQIDTLTTISKLAKDRLN
jgi:DNA-binding PadR family transcriptional regulator